MNKGIFPMAAASIGGLLLGLAFTMVFDAGYGAFEDVTTEVRANGDRLDRMERVLLSAIKTGKRQSVRTTSSSSVRRQSRASADAPSGDAVVESTAEHVSRDAAEELPPKDMGALAPLANWDVDESVRRRWTFASEASALDAFGPPDEISTRAGAETWSYRTPEVNGRVGGEYRLKFNNGRVVKGEFVQREKPRTVSLSLR